MARQWSGVLTVEGKQTGDGRIIADGATKWPALPLPLAYLPQEQHGDLLGGAFVIGNITSAERMENGDIVGTGVIDDTDPVGAELVRKMDEGVAPFGSKWGVSIDPDDWIVDVVDTDAVILEEDQPVPAEARGTRVRGNGLSAMTNFRSNDGWVSSLAAAAGDPMPETGDVLWTDKADSLIAAFQRLRMRGATMCAIPAFDGARISLAAASAAMPAEDGQQSDESAPVEDAEPVAAAATAPARTRRFAPPSEWFRNPGLVGPTRMTIEVGKDRQHRTYGHVALRNSCHTGYTDRCVRPPMGGDYVEFRQGRVTTSEGYEVQTGVLTWGIPHADLTLPMLKAQEHYANSKYRWADAVCGEDEWGIWYAGATRPGLEDDDLYVLDALSISGDWRWAAHERRLKMIAALAVNYPGFPIIASGAEELAIRPQLSMEGDQPLALVAAGMVTCDLDAMQREAADARTLDQAFDAIDRLQKIVAPLRRQRADALLDRIRA